MATQIARCAAIAIAIALAVVTVAINLDLQWAVTPRAIGLIATASLLVIVPLITGALKAQKRYVLACIAFVISIAILGINVAQSTFVFAKRDGESYSSNRDHNARILLARERLDETQEIRGKFCKGKSASSDRCKIAKQDESAARQSLESLGAIRADKSSAAIDNQIVALVPQYIGAALSLIIDLTIHLLAYLAGSIQRRTAPQIEPVKPRKAKRRRPTPRPRPVQASKTPDTQRTQLHVVK